MAFNVRQMPADRAAALIGEDDVAVFSQRLETMAATSQFDLEEPDSTRLTFLFEVGKDDLLREGKWLDGVDYMSDLIFETPRDLAGKVFKRFETFADDDHTPSEALADVRWGFARFGGTCTVLSGLSEKEALDMEKKGDVGANTPNGKAGAEQHPEAPAESPVDLAHRAAAAARRSHVQMEDAATHLARHRSPEVRMFLHAVKKPAGEARAGADEDEDGGRIARTKGGFP